METEQDKPVDRDAWRQLLDGDDAPPALTDARIRAAARRALAPRTNRSQRWWLPASLAASLLLAVLVVQWQFGERGATLISESDYAASTAEEPVSRQVAPPSPPRAAPHTGEREGDPGIGYVEMAPMSAPPPAIELPAQDESRAADAPSADAMTRERDELSEMKVESARRRKDAAQATPPTPVSGVTQQNVTGSSAGIVGGLQKSPNVLPAPEDWYAAIADLRAAGRHEEAERERERLEAAYPGWLEKNHPQDR